MAAHLDNAVGVQGMMVGTSPPSTLNAAPVVATDCSDAT